MPQGADFWVNARFDPQDIGHGLNAVLRVKPGTTIERLKSELAVAMTGLARDFPVGDAGREFVVQSLVASIVGDLGPTLLIVFAATTLLLLLACVNVTNLLLGRGAARAREIAVRTALGASRMRIVRQLLTESFVVTCSARSPACPSPSPACACCRRLGHRSCRGSSRSRSTLACSGSPRSSSVSGLVLGSRRPSVWRAPT
jgi:hypothetical protein